MQDIQSRETFTKTARHLNVELMECLQRCLNCYSICNQTLQHCLEMGGLHSKNEHIQLLIDCTKICETAASFITRNSKLHMDICRVCAEVCRLCAKSCSAIEDDTMAICAEVCTECATSCEKLSTH